MAEEFNQRALTVTGGLNGGFMVVTHGLIEALGVLGEKHSVPLVHLVGLVSVLQVLDGGQIHGSAELGTILGLQPEEVKKAVRALQMTGWLTLTDGQLSVHLPNQQPVTASRATARRKTSLDEVGRAWERVTGETVSDLTLVRALRMCPGDVLVGSPRNSDLLAEFYRAIHPTATVEAFLEALLLAQDELADAAAVWMRAGKPELKKAAADAEAILGAWRSRRLTTRRAGDFFLVAGAAVAGVSPSQFEAACRPDLGLAQILERCMQQKGSRRGARHLNVSAFFK